MLLLKTTTTRLANNRVYGFIEFSINGKAFRLPVYQSPDLMKQAAYFDYLQTVANSAMSLRTSSQRAAAAMDIQRYGA